MYYWSKNHLYFINVGIGVVMKSGEKRILDYKKYLKLEEIFRIIGDI